MFFDKVNNNCTGCSACAQSCIRKCISMRENEEGFLYPVLTNTDSCIDCGRCEQVCPSLVCGDEMFKSPISVYAAFSKDQIVLCKSTSGGVFIELAKNIISSGGVVFGCAFDSEYNPQHIRVSKIPELALLQGSKYVQSDVKNTFCEAKLDLHNNITVLYSGTPCQIAGLKKYLNKSHKNLITIDLICHGVPNNKLFHDYLDYLNCIYKGKIINYSFRNKKQNGWSLTSSFEISKNNKKIIINQNSETNPYYYGFIKGITYRYSCYSCKYATDKRVGDITLGDFWGIEDIIFKVKIDQGVSLVLINSEKGEKRFNSILENLITLNMDYSLAKRKNHNLVHPSNKPLQRESFYKTLACQGFKKVVKKYLRPRFYWIAILKSKIPNKIKKKIKLMMRKI